MQASHCKTRKQLFALNVEPKKLESLLQVQSCEVDGVAHGTFRVRDVDVAQALHLLPNRWAYVERVLLKGPTLSARDRKKIVLREALPRVACRSVLLSQVGLTLQQRAAFLNVPAGNSRLFNRWNLRQLYKEAGIKLKSTRLRLSLIHI